MNSSRSARCVALALGCAVSLVAVGSALALQKPGRTIITNGPVRLVALNQASFAYMVSRSKKDCDHVELWNTSNKGVWRFGKPGPCTNLGSTGTGISALGVSGNRALWVRYTGGNTREWQLLTATATQRTPRQLRFVAQDVDLPTPFVIGDATGGQGIPYAADRDVVLLAASGAAVFKRREPARITRVTSGKGPAGAVVAALRETGEVAMLRVDGSLAWTVDYEPREVKAIALAPVGLIVQLAGEVQIRTPTGSASVNLPRGAAMTDFSEGRILYTLKNEIHAFKISNDKDTLLLASGSRAPAIVATADTHGLGWAQGRSVNFACGGCVKYTAGATTG